MTDAAALTPAQVTAHIGNATGELGFLKWAETLPAAISAPALEVAAVISAARQKGLLSGLRGGSQGTHSHLTYQDYQRGLYGLRGRRFGRLGQLTDQQLADETGLDLSDVQDMDLTSGGTSTTPPAATTVATSTPASTSWLSSLGSVLSTGIQAAGQAYLTVSQVNTANSIVQTNLQRAQQGLPPLPYTAAQLGLTGPTVNLGVASSTLMPILLLGGGAILLFALIGAAKRS